MFQKSEFPSSSLMEENITEYSEPSDGNFMKCSELHVNEKFE